MSGPCFSAIVGLSFRFAQHVCTFLVKSSLMHIDTFVPLSQTRKTFAAAAIIAQRVHLTTIKIQKQVSGKLSALSLNVAETSWFLHMLSWSMLHVQIFISHGVTALLQQLEIFGDTVHGERHSNEFDARSKSLELMDVAMWEIRIFAHWCCWGLRCDGIDRSSFKFVWPWPTKSVYSLVITFWYNTIKALHVSWLECQTMRELSNPLFWDVQQHVVARYMSWPSREPLYNPSKNNTTDIRFASTKLGLKSNCWHDNWQHSQLSAWLLPWLSGQQIMHGSVDNKLCMAVWYSLTNAINW